VTPILIGFEREHPELISAIQIDERWLSDAEIEDFAIRDGFGVNFPAGTALAHGAILGAADRHAGSLPWPVDPVGGAGD
jgi:hypothetical protein